MTESTSVITVEIVRKALYGAAIATDGELFAQQEGVIPQECGEAIKTISDNFFEFKNLVGQRLSSNPNISSYFGPLIWARLIQKGYLTSLLISMLFDDNQQVEHRLLAIQDIPGIAALKNEYHPSSDRDLGYQTDWSARDLLAEILALFFLKMIGFSNIRKQSSANRQSHVDITAEKDCKKYAIEVTRKKEITGWETISSGGLEDCNSLENHQKIRALLIKALSTKDSQFRRCINSGEISFGVTKIVAIKTSDYGFAECIDQAEEISKNLLAEIGNWENVDGVWLIPNIDAGQSRWVFRN